MKLVHYLLQHSWRLVTFAVVTGALSGLASAGLVAVINKGLSEPDQFVTLSWIFFGLCAVLLVTKLCSEISLLHLTQKAIFHLRLDLSRKLLATPYKRLQELGKHRLLVILADDVHTLTNAFEWVPVLFINSVVLVACLSYLAWLSLELLLMLGATMLVGIVGFHFAERRPLAHLAKVRELKDHLYRNFRDLIEGSRELQLNHARSAAFVQKVITPAAAQYKEWFTRGMAGYSLVASVGVLIFYINIGVLLFLIPHFLRQPTEILSGFTVALLYLIRPITEVLIALPGLRQADIALNKIGQLEQELNVSEIQPGTVNPFASTTGLCLQLRGVCHQYPREGDDRHFLLGPVDLTLSGGELIFVVGGNGSGKTTLAMLLLGFYTPEAGQIILNGQAVNDTNRHHYRQYFSAVFADFHLFEELLGVDHPDLNVRAQHYIQALGMQHKVRIEDGKFSTLNLSTGQRKRLALVASYLEDRPVYLFDEWAADQDPVFKRVFYTSLLPDLKALGKTVIVISHDDAYFQCADRVLKLQDGKLLPEEGRSLAPATAVTRL